MGLQPTKLQRLMKRGIKFLAASKDMNEGTVTEKIIAPSMQCSVSKVRRLSEEIRRKDPIPLDDLNAFTLSCFANAPEIPSKWVNDLFRANDTKLEHMSDALKQAIKDRQRSAIELARPRLADQRHLLRLTQSLVGRKGESNQIKEWLTSVETAIQPTTKVVVIGGMAGVGKTALAQSVGQDPDVEQCFRDGVLWAELGPNPNIESWIKEWVSLLKTPKDTIHNPAVWLWKHLATEERRALIILDDVWPGTSFERLMAGGAKCRILITSQVATIADLYEKVCRLQLRVLAPNQALELALQAFEREPTEEELEGLRKAVNCVGSLPLAICVMVAAMKSDGVAQVTERLQPQYDDKLQTAEPERVRRLTVPGAEPRQADVRAAFQVNYEGLNLEDRQRFRALGNMPRVTSFGVRVLAALWGDEVRQAQEAARRFAERSLIERVGENRYRIHDLLHDFAADVAEMVGERDTEGKWVDRFRGGLVKEWRWWWPSVPRSPGVARRFSQAWFVEGVRELWMMLRRPYWVLLQRNWETKSVAAEVWASGKWLHRQGQKHIRHLWYILLALIAAICIGFAAYILWRKVHPDPRSSLLGIPLVSWLTFYYRTAPHLLPIAFLLWWWQITVNYINFHRLYGLPVECYDSPNEEIPS